MSLTCTEIIPNLWLGSLKDAQDLNFLKTANIQTVVNCTKDIDFYNPKLNNIRIPVDDNLEYDQITLLYTYLNKIADVIHSSLRKHEPVLVHCFAGKQRSCSVIAAFLMKHLRLSFSEAAMLMKTKREICFEPTVNFRKALEEFEMKLKKTE